jgi:hypothetical protein
VGSPQVARLPSQGADAECITDNEDTRRYLGTNRLETLKRFALLMKNG